MLREQISVNPLSILNVPETNVYMDHEVTCPFCECSFLNIVSNDDMTRYKCSECGGRWDVIGS